MAMDPDLFFFILSVCCAFILGIWLALWLKKRLEKRAGRRHGRRGSRAEDLARVILEDEGFEILEENPSFISRLLINGDPTEFRTTPDLLVEKDGQQYIVEVKNRPDFNGIYHAPIRRQVLEYLYATELPCLLVSMPEADLDIIEKVNKT